MTEYALVGPADEIKEFRSNIDPTVGTREGWRWLPVVVTDPAVNVALQVKEGPVTTVEVEQVTRVFTVRDKTAPELDADKIAAVGALNGTTYTPLLKALLNLHNRIRVLEGAGTHTMAQFKAALKALL